MTTPPTPILYICADIPDGVTLRQWRDDEHERQRFDRQSRQRHFRRSRRAAGRQLRP